MTLKLPQIIAHRGASAYAPENTLAAIQSAADMGIDWVELDVKLTSDDIPIIFHDNTFDRTTNMTGLVMEAPYSALSEVDAGAWFAESFIGEKIPTLEDAVELIIELNLGLNLELKPCEGRDIETARVALDALARIWDDHDKILVSSFSEVCLETAADMVQGDWALGYCIDETPEFWRDIAAHLGVKTINLNGNRPDLTREFIEDIIDEGYSVLVYTINNPMKAKELISWGVDSVFTDEPDVIRDELFSMH